MNNSVQNMRKRLDNTSARRGLRRGFVRYDVHLHRVAGAVVVVAVAVRGLVHEDCVRPRRRSVAQREVVSVVVDGENSIFLFVVCLNRNNE